MSIFVVYRLCVGYTGSSIPMSSSSTTSSVTILDITQEKRDLKHSIAVMEHLYKRMLKQAERLNREITDFQRLYDEKILGLYQRLNELESVLFKYRHISEYVDDIFSFSEAQKIFDETMKDRQARMDNEYRKQKKRQSFDRKNNLSEKHKEELKRFYRNLAHIFHPDKNGGDEQMMKRINKAYREGNLDALRDMDLEYIPRNEDETKKGLEHRLQSVILKIEKAKKEIVSIRKSDMYILMRNILKTNKAKDGTILDSLAKELRKEINRKQDEVDQFIEKFGHAEKTARRVS